MVGELASDCKPSFIAVVSFLFGRLERIGNNSDFKAKYRRQ